MEKSGFFGKLMNLTKPKGLEFTEGHPTCHSALRTFLSGVAESIIGSQVDSGATFHYAKNDN